MAERVREVRAGRGGMRGPRPRVENPGLILRRILDYVMQYYKINAIVAVVCIVIRARCLCRPLSTATLCRC